MDYEIKNLAILKISSDYIARFLDSGLSFFPVHGLRNIGIIGSTFDSRDDMICFIIHSLDILPFLLVNDPCSNQIKMVEINYNNQIIKLPLIDLRGESIQTEEIKPISPIKESDQNFKEGSIGKSMEEWEEELRQSREEEGLE